MVRGWENPLTTTLKEINMNKGIILIIIILLFCACQPNPDKQSVNDKTHIEDELIVQSIKEGYEAPEHAEKTIKTNIDTITVKLDAQVVLLKVSKIPIIQTQEKIFSEQDFFYMVDYFEPEAKLYYLPPETKEYYSNEIVFEKKSWADNEESRNGLSEDQKQELLEQYNESIAFLEEEMKKAPDKLNLDSFIYGKREDGSEMLDKEEGNCVVNLDHKTNTYGLFTYGKNKNMIAYSRDNYINQPERWVIAGNAMLNEPPGTTIDVRGIDKEQALEKANKVLKDFNIKNMVVGNVEPFRLVSKYEIKGTGWQFEFIKSISDIEVTWIDDLSYACMKKFPPSIGAPWRIERVIICIDQEGVEYFSWVGASQGEQVINDNIELLAFDALIERIANQINQFYIDSPGTIFTIKKMELGYSLISVKDKTDSGYYVPTWYVTFEYVEPENKDFAPVTEMLMFTAYDGAYYEPRMTTHELMELTYN